MTEYLNDDFEGTSPWDETHEQNGTYTYGSTDHNKCPPTGSKCGKAVTTDQSGLVYALLREALNDPTERYFRAYLHLPTLTPDNEPNILHMMFHQASTPTIWCILGIGMSKDGSTPKWRVRDGINGTWEFIASPTPVAGQDFCVEIYVKKHATEGILRIWIDNNVEGSPDWEKTGLDTSGITLGQAYLGTISSSWDVGHTAHHDCAKISDTFNGTIAEGQTYEINVDAVVKTSAAHVEQCTFNIAKDAAVSSQAIRAPETIFNVPKDAVAKVLTALNFELGIPVEAILKASATSELESTFNVSKEVIVKALTSETLETTFNIQKDAFVQALATVVVEKITGLVDIFKDAVITAQADFAIQWTSNVEKDALSQAVAAVGVETIFNVVKDAIIQASASSIISNFYMVNVDAVAKASATSSLQQTLGISKEAVVVTVSTPLIQSTFNISKDAMVKVLAEVSVIKEGEVLKVTKLFLILGNLAIQLQGD